jgi:hypothetical protein
MKKKKDPAYVERLEALADTLTEQLFEEADPKKWTGGSKDLLQMTKQERGDRYWDKKNAAMTLTLVVKMHSLIDLNLRTKGGKIKAAGEEEEAETLENEIKKANKAAMRIMEKVQAGKPH